MQRNSAAPAAIAAQFSRSLSVVFAKFIVEWNERCVIRSTSASGILPSIASSRAVHNLRSGSEAEILREWRRTRLEEKFYPPPSNALLEFAMGLDCPARYGQPSTVHLRRISLLNERFLAVLLFLSALTSGCANFQFRDAKSGQSLKIKFGPAGYLRVTMPDGRVLKGQYKDGSGFAEGDGIKVDIIYVEDPAAIRWGGVVAGTAHDNRGNEYTMDAR